MIAQKYVVLFFITTSNPSAEERNASLAFGPHVAFRNARFVNVGEPCEPCTAVYGAVPQNYADKYPEAVSIADYYAGRLPVIEIDVAAPGEATDAPFSGGGNAADFDPFAAVGGGVAPRGGKGRKAANWNPQG